MLRLRPLSLTLLFSLPWIAGCSSDGAPDGELAKIAAPKLSCAADEVKVLSRDVGDTSASYVVEGCGKKGSLLCETPMKDCIYAGDSQ